MDYNNLLDSRNPSYSGIISGICKGDLWLNDKVNPSIAVAYSYCVGGCGVLGTLDELSDSEIKSFLDSVHRELLKKDIDWFEFSCENISNYARILKLYEGREVFSEIEYSFRRNQKYDTLCSVDPTISFLEVDQNVLNDIEAGRYQNSDMLMDRLVHSWNSKDDFLNQSKAFLAVKENCLIGIIFGSARYQDVIPIDIEVEEQYRRMGIAARLTQAMVNSCSENGIVSQWDCVESNTASRALVAYLEFEPFKERPYYWFQI